MKNNFVINMNRNPITHGISKKRNEFNWDTARYGNVD